MKFKVGDIVKHKKKDWYNIIVDINEGYGYKGYQYGKVAIHRTANSRGLAYFSIGFVDKEWEYMDSVDLCGE